MQNYQYWASIIFQFFSFNTFVFIKNNAGQLVKDAINIDNIDKNIKVYTRSNEILEWWSKVDC